MSRDQETSMRSDQVLPDVSTHITIAELVQGFIEVGSLLSGPKPLATRMRGLCAAAVTALRCDRFNVLVIEGDYYRGAYQWGQPPAWKETFTNYRVNRRKPMIAQIEACDSYLLFNQARHAPGMERIAEIAGVESVVLVPFTHPDGSPYGYITADYLSHKRTISLDEAQLAMGIAKIVQTTLLRDLETQRRREVSKAMLDTADIERSRLSREIHDESLQQILGLRIGLESYRDQLDTQDQKDAVERFIAQCRSASTGLRALMAGEHPSDVVTRSLEESLNSVLERTMVGRGVKFTYNDDRHLRPPHLDSTLIRIGEQAVRNALLHASATRIDVRIADHEHGMLFSVRDDGCGFEPDDIGEGRLGLVSMRERTELRSGTFSIESSPGSGTMVSAWFPAPPQQT